jgi:hypothetical protein
MIKLATLIFLISVISLAGMSQSDSMFHFVREQRGNIVDYNIDNLGNIYLLYQNGQLKKLRPNGDSLAVFNNVRRFGKLYSIDVSNPLKVLLYYKDFGTIVILDRFLNQRAIVDLRSQNLPQVGAVGQAYDNNIWIFDELDLKLKKISDEGRMIDQSTDFRLVFDSVPNPTHIIDNDKLVYLYDSLKGVYVFDYYGGFQNRIPFTGWTDFEVINKALFGRDKNYLYRYDMGSLQLQQIPSPSFINNAQKVIVFPGNVYVLKDGVFMVYSYN